MAEITQGLIVSAFGLGITFAALTFVILVISLLKRLFPAKSESEPEVDVETVAAAARVEGGEEEEVAAAIAIALHLIKSPHTHARLGASLESGHGAWWRANHIVSIRRRIK